MIFMIFSCMRSIFKNFEQPFRNHHFSWCIWGSISAPQEPSLASIVHGLWKTAADAGAVEAAVRDMAKEPENSKDPRRGTWDVGTLAITGCVVFLGVMEC